MRASLISPGESTPNRSLSAYLRAGGYCAWAQARSAASPERLLLLVERSGLKGKGGAGFSAHEKMRLMRQQPGEHKFLVINGCEHEPGSLKDRYLLENHPHAVLEGALLLAFIVGAVEIVVAINEGAIASLERFRQALRETQSDASIDLGGIEVSVRPVPDSYIVGEESALLEALQGRSALPWKKPPFPIAKGLDGLPTLVHNVETAVHLTLIAKSGAEAYRALGLNGDGITLCTLGREFLRPGVYEIPLGTPIRNIVNGVGGGLRDRSTIKAVQPGGPSSGFLGSSQLDLPLHPQVLAAHGSALGCAAIRAYSERECMVGAIGRILQFFAGACCGQCPRCRMETGMLARILEQVLAGRGSWKLLEQVDAIIELARGQGICGLIAMPVAPLRTGLALFRSDFAAHIDGDCQLCHAQDGDPQAESTMGV